MRNEIYIVPAFKGSTSCPSPLFYKLEYGEFYKWVSSRCRWCRCLPHKDNAAAMVRIGTNLRMK